jgi:hypothetical protein
VLCPGAVNTGIVANSAEIHQRVTGAPVRPAGVLDEITGGMDPDDVGHLVLDAIRNDQFWIFTAPELVASVETQVAALASDQSLSRLRLR